jgi:hypothetical protein
MEGSSEQGGVWKVGPLQGESVHQRDGGRLLSDGV